MEKLCQHVKMEVGGFAGQGCLGNIRLAAFVMSALRPGYHDHVAESHERQTATMGTRAESRSFLLEIHAVAANGKDKTR
jgi:hypothetical protein